MQGGREGALGLGGGKRALELTLRSGWVDGQTDRYEGADHLWAASREQAPCLPPRGRCPSAP